MTEGTSFKQWNRESSYVDIEVPSYERDILDLGTSTCSSSKRSLTIACACQLASCTKSTKKGLRFSGQLELELPSRTGVRRSRNPEKQEAYGTLPSRLEQDIAWMLRQKLNNPTGGRAAGRGRHAQNWPCSNTCTQRQQNGEVH